ncbi:hypothetical protein Tco_1226501 [Tanacetum coccineum]
MEECLRRNSSDNWCIINDGTEKPNIVNLSWGFQGNRSETNGNYVHDMLLYFIWILKKPAELVEISPVLEDRIPNDVPKVQLYPRPIMSWSSLLYSKVFEGIADFKLRENVSMPGIMVFLLADVVLSDSVTLCLYLLQTMYLASASSVEMANQLLRIVGSIIHLFLWDYEARNMSYLKHLKRTPEYRLVY